MSRYARDGFTCVWVWYECVETKAQETSKAEDQNGLRLLASQRGIEPPAFPLGGGRSIRLSY